MKKLLGRFVALLLVSILTLGYSSSVLAKENIEKLDNITGFDGIKETNLEIKDISREEFIENYAEQNNISFNEADVLDKVKTFQDYQLEKNQAARILSTLEPRETVYRQVTKTYNTGSSGKFTSSLIVVIQVKIERYYSSGYGDYQKFTQVLSIGADAYGSGTPTWKTIAQSADISEYTAYENKIVMMLSGNIETNVTISFTAGASGSGFTLTTTSGDTYHYRKLIQLNETFGSNYNLN